MCRHLLIALKRNKEWNFLKIPWFSGVLEAKHCIPEKLSWVQVTFQRITYHHAFFIWAVSLFIALGNLTKTLLRNMGSKWKQVWVVQDINKSRFTIDSLAGLVLGAQCQAKKTQHDSLQELTLIFHLMVYWRKMSHPVCMLSFIVLPYQSSEWGLQGKLGSANTGLNKLRGSVLRNEVFRGQGLCPLPVCDIT